MINEISLFSNKLIVEKTKESTKFFNHLFTDIKYFISGSFLMNIVFFESASYSDIDLYFPSKSSWKVAKKRLHDSSHFVTERSTKYAITYKCISNGVLLQLVNKPVKSLTHLAFSHDFANCSLAANINTSTLFISPKALQAWQRKTLEYNFSPLLKRNFSSSQFCNQLNLFYIRIVKYTSRYNLELSDCFKKKLKKILHLHQKHLAKMFLKKTNFYVDYANTYYTSKYTQIQLHKKLKLML